MLPTAGTLIYNSSLFLPRNVKISDFKFDFVVTDTIKVGLSLEISCFVITKKFLSLNKSCGSAFFVQLRIILNLLSRRFFTSSGEIDE